MQPLFSTHIIGSRHSGGAERFYVRLVGALAELGLHTVAINRPRSSVSTELEGLVEQYHVSMGNVRDPFSRFRISRLLSRLNPQIVQTYMGRATRLTRVPAGCRAVHVSRLGGFYKLDGYRHADAWIGNTAAICDYLVENGFPSKKVFLLPNFVQIPPPLDEQAKGALRSRLGVPEDALVIAGVGRLVAKKGFGHLIESFGRLPQDVGGRPLHLVIVGSGPEETPLRDLAFRNRAGERIHWAGWQSDPDPYFALADLFVCPSLHEPLGNVIMEAWSNGTPVISTRTHGALELIQEGVNGLLVPCGDSQALAAGMETALREGEPLLGDLVSGGFSTLAARFGKKAVVESYIDLYTVLVTGNPGRTGE